MLMTLSQLPTPNEFAGNENNKILKSSREHFDELFKAEVIDPVVLPR